MGGEFFTHLRNAGRLDANSTRFYSAQVTAIFECVVPPSSLHPPAGRPQGMHFDGRHVLRIRPPAPYATHTSWQPRGQVTVFARRASSDARAPYVTHTAAISRRSVYLHRQDFMAWNGMKWNEME